MLAMYINSEASTIVKSVTGLEGIVAWTSLHAKYSRRTLGRIFRAQREGMYPKLAKDVGQVRLDLIQWEEKRDIIMSELGKGATILDVRRAPSQKCPKKVK